MASSLSEIDPDRPVGHIVRTYPQTASVFETHGIDYCCNGSQSLGDAAKTDSIPLDDLTDALRNAASKPSEPAEWESLSALIDHIETQHHAYLRNEFPSLLQQVTKVRIVHEADHPELAAVYRTVVELADEMLRHIRDEETAVFPIIAKGERGESVSATEAVQLKAEINEMEHDHEATADALDRLADLTNGFSVPDGACQSYESMLDRLEQLQRDTYQHVHKENNILFQDAVTLLE